MCKKLMLLSCLVTVLGLSNIAFADFEVFKVDFSCPDQQATEKGGDWEDLKPISGCDGDRHDPAWLLGVAGTSIDIGAGQWGGHGNMFARGGDPICNTTYKHWTTPGACGDNNITLALRYLDPETTYTVYTYHAWSDGSILSVTTEGDDSNNIINVPQVVNTTSDTVLLADTDSRGEIQFTTDVNGAQVLIQFNGCVRFNAFELYSAEPKPMALSPNPSSYETDVCPNNVQLSWKPTDLIQDPNHDVYFDPNYYIVRDANRTDDPCGVLVSQNQDSNEYPEDGNPLLKLQLNTTYYWRVDTVNDPCLHPSSTIWEFTTEDGNARDPSPGDGFRGLNPDPNVLTWTPSCVAAAQDVYFSADFCDVNELKPAGLYDSLGPNDNNITPTLETFTTYYWRVKTTSSGDFGGGIVAGEVWTFTTGLGGLLLEMLFEGNLNDDLPNPVIDTSGNLLEFTKYTDSGSIKYGEPPFAVSWTPTSADFDPCAGLYRLDPGPNTPDNPDILRLACYQHTIQFWVKPERLDPDMDTEEPGEEEPDLWLDHDWDLMLIGKFDSWMIGIQNPGDDNAFKWLHSVGSFTMDNDSAEVGEWAHLTAVYYQTMPPSGGGIKEFYLNGTLEETGWEASQVPADNNYPVTIGYAYQDDVNMGRYFEGKIDELQIWDIALEPELEIATQSYPENGSRGWELTDGNLATFTWKPGTYAANVDGHNIYFGTSLDDVNESADPNVTGHDSNSWTHGFTFNEKGRTYFWRVDEVNGTDVWPGLIWTFQMRADLIDPNIVVYYPLDETGGYAVPDYSGRYFDAECASAPHWEPDNGRYDGCMHFSMVLEWDDDDKDWDWAKEEPGNFDTISNYGAEAASLINKEISISVWVNGDPNQRDDEDMVVFEFCDEGYDDGIKKDPEHTKIFAVVPEEGTGDVVFRAGDYPLDTLIWKGFEPLAARGTWQHFVFIKNDNDANMYIYLNTELVATKEDCNTITLANLVASGDVALKIGAWHDSSSGYHGRIDDFQIYNKQLNEQEIEKIHRGGILAPAWAPSPYDGQGDVPYTTDQLTWKPGAYVADTNGHEVYFGTNYDDVFGANTIVHPNVVHDTCSVTIYDPGPLELDHTYYWRVDEVNDACDPNGWKGRVWKFVVANFVTIDDFEDDTPQDPPANDWLEIASASISLRSEALLTPPEIIGKNSMKFVYNNWWDYGPGFYSEIESISLEPNDWTIFDQKLKALSLWFYGDPANAATETEQMYVYLKDNDDPNNEFQVKYGDADWEDTNDVKIADWQEWFIPFSHFSNNDVNLANLDNLCIGFGIRGNKVDPGMGSFGGVYFDNIRLYPATCTPWVVLEGDLNGDCVVDSEDVKIMAVAWLDSDCNCIEEYESMPSPPGEPNLVAWYEFDTGSGGTATDSTSNNYHGTISVIDVNVFWTAPGYDGTGGALDFDGGWVSVPNTVTPVLNINDTVTVSCWINRAESSDDSIQLVCKGRNDKETYCLEVTGDEKLAFLVRDSNSDNQDIEGDKTLPLDEWLHVAGTCDGNNMTIYLNGRVEKTEKKGYFWFHADGNDGLGIAERWGDIEGDEDDFYPFIGIIDDVRIYDYALSDGEICYIASDGDGVAEMVNIANMSKDEPAGKQVVNLKDFAELANNWLKEELWP